MTVRTTYRPTTLSLIDSSCPYALDLYERGVPQERSRFEVGIAAHAVLQAVTDETAKRGRDLTQDELETVALGVVKSLSSVGRDFDGTHEPPLNPGRALAGKDLAVQYLSQSWTSIEAQAELGLAVDADWQPVDYYSPEARLRCIVDYAVVETVEDEETAAVTLIVRDYKSAWPTDESALDTLQRRVQAVLAAIHWQRKLGRTDLDALRLEVVNLRTWRTYERTIPLAGESVTLAEWRRDISAILDGLDEQARLGSRPASPGANCLGCPYIEFCEHAQDYMERRGMHRTPVKRAVAYAVARASLDELEQQVRLDVGDEHIDVPGGVVGYYAQEKRALKSTAYAEICEAWGDDMRGLVKALQPSVTAAERVARVLYPEREERDERRAFLDALIEPKIEKRFGVYVTAGAGKEETTNAT